MDKHDPDHDNTAPPFSLVIETPSWRNEISDLEGLLKTCFHAVGEYEPDSMGILCVLFSNDKKLHALNAQFRGQDKPTNVLSFPNDGFMVGDSDDEMNKIHLGDIALAFETCKREAEEKKILFQDHATHLIIHGLLHLCGYDHEEQAAAEQMEALEIRILANMNINNPYKDGETI